MLRGFGVLFCCWLAACAYPVRTGYDRNAGAYASVPSAKTSATTAPASPKSADSNATNSPVAATAPTSSAKRAAPAKRPTAAAKGNVWEQAVQPWLGTPYLLGGQSKKGVDCSGFSLSIMQTVKGISIPRSTGAAWKAGKAVSKGNLQPGDVVFFGNIWGVNHNGIWLGNGKFAHASSSRGVIITELENDAYWSARYRGARRY